MSYFHTGIRTIIGAEAFHCPVRDGKEWDHLAMVIRLNRLLPWTSPGQPIRRVCEELALLLVLFASIRSVLDYAKPTIMA
jgi:hypothetical protein